MKEELEHEYYEWIIYQEGKKTGIKNNFMGVIEFLESKGMLKQWM